MKQLLLVVGKALGLLALGAASGVLAMAGRRRRTSDHLVVTVWSKNPGESTPLTQTLVRKIDGRWINADDGFTVNEVRVKE